MQTTSKKPFSPNVLHLPTRVLKDERLNGTDHHLYGLILFFSKLGLGYCSLSNPNLAMLVNKQERYVRKRISNLLTLGYIRKQEFGYKKRAIFPLVGLHYNTKKKSCIGPGRTIEEEQVATTYSYSSPSSGLTRFAPFGGMAPSAPVNPVLKKAKIKSNDGNVGEKRGTKKVSRETPCLDPGPALSRHGITRTWPRLNIQSDEPFARQINGVVTPEYEAWNPGCPASCFYEGKKVPPRLCEEGHYFPMKTPITHPMDLLVLNRWEYDWLVGLTHVSTELIDKIARERILWLMNLEKTNYYAYTAICKDLLEWLRLQIMAKKEKNCLPFEVEDNGRPIQWSSSTCLGNNQVNTMGYYPYLVTSTGRCHVFTWWQFKELEQDQYDAYNAPEKILQRQKEDEEFEQAHKDVPYEI